MGFLSITLYYPKYFIKSNKIRIYSIFHRNWTRWRTFWTMKPKARKSSVLLHWKIWSINWKHRVKSCFWWKVSTWINHNNCLHSSATIYNSIDIDIQLKACQLQINRLFLKLLLCNVVPVTGFNVNFTRLLMFASHL